MEHPVHMSEPVERECVLEVWEKQRKGGREGKRRKKGRKGNTFYSQSRYRIPDFDVILNAKEIFA